SVEAGMPNDRSRAIATEADPDPDSNALRELIARRDLDGLQTLVGDVGRRPANRPRLHLIAKALTRYRPRVPISLNAAIRDENPSDFWFNFDLGWAHLTSEPANPTEAARFFTTATAIRPTNPVAHLGLGFALANHGRYAKAERESREAIRLKPDSP